MPGNLADTDPTHSAINFPIDIMIRLPELSSLIMQTISHWSHVESNLLSTLAHFTRGSEATAAVKELADLNGHGRQKKQLLKKAKCEMSEQSLDLLKDMLEVIKPYGFIRGRFAHHIWGVCNALPDEIILIAPKERWLVIGGVKDYWRSDGFSKGGFANMPKLDHTLIEIWSRNELSTLISELEEIIELTINLNQYFNPLAPKRHLNFRNLSHNPSMQKACETRTGNPRPSYVPSNL